MRDLGMGKHLGEERMLEELQFLIELIKSFKGELETASSVSCYFTKPLEELWVAAEMTNTVNDFVHF